MQQTSRLKVRLTPPHPVFLRASLGLEDRHFLEKRDNSGGISTQPTASTRFAFLLLFSQAAFGRPPLVSGS